jgi:mono/diheme cytochrome c family protein
MKSEIKFIISGFISILAIGSCMFLNSCGTAKRSEPVMGKLDIKNENVFKGQMVFIKNCHKCHPGGQAGEGPSINNIPLPGGLIRFRVRDKAFLLGLGKMPSFKKHEITSNEMDNLISYLKVIRKNKNN